MAVKVIFVSRFCSKLNISHYSSLGKAKGSESTPFPPISVHIWNALAGKEKVGGKKANAQKTAGINSSRPNIDVTQPNIKENPGGNSFQLRARLK